MRDPERPDLHRLERDAGNFLVGFGERLLGGREIDLEQIEAGEGSVRIERLTRPPQEVTVSGGPYGEGRQRAAFGATIGVECAPDERRLDLRIEFEVDLEGGHISQEPNFELTEVTRVEPAA